jgi:hypothetical protein
MIRASTHVSSKEGLVMHPAFELEQKLKAYIEHEVSLDELRQWYRSAAGALLSLAVETRELELATTFQLCLIEFDKGDFSERLIRTHLSKAMGRELRMVVQTEPVLTTSISETVVTQGIGASSEPSSMTIIGYQLTPTGRAS